MSGFEIAGVVLGALPLVAKALESYSEGLSVVRTVMHYEQQFEELHARFEFAWMMYFASCQRLLSPIPISSQESKELVEHPTSDRWKDPSLNLELRRRLGGAYEPYLIATRALHGRVEKLKKKLKLNDDYLPRWVTKSGDTRCEDAAERARFFSRSRWSRVSGPIDVVRCKSLVDQIDHEIERISNFVKDVTELEVPRKEHQQQIDSTYWITVRDHAHRVFKGFESRWSRPCTCHQLHRASLQLHVRDTGTRCDCSDHRLKCILSFQNDSSGSNNASPPWDWCDIEIEPKPVDVLQVQPISASVPSVRFATPFPSNLGTVSATAAPINTQKDHLGTKIVDLCNSLSHAASTTSTIGFLDEQAWKHYIHAAVHCKRPLATRTIMSLRDIIKKRPQGDLSTKEKRTLALKMALAVLQLHDTPWIDSEYGHRSVFFITNTSSPHIPLFEPAYVSRSFVATNVTDQSTHLKSDGRILAKNKLLYALGIALIELSYGQPLLTLALSDELDARGDATSRTEMLVAGRLLQNIRERELVNYAWATACCVQCDLGYPFDYSLNDDTFRAKFIEKVIEPLKDDYDEIFLTK